MLWKPRASHPRVSADPPRDAGAEGEERMGWGEGRVKYLRTSPCPLPQQAVTPAPSTEGKGGVVMETVIHHMEPDICGCHGNQLLGAFPLLCTKEIF